MQSRSFIRLLILVLLLVLSSSQIINITASSQSASSIPYQTNPYNYCSATNIFKLCINCYAGYYIDAFGVCVLGNPLCASYNMRGGACLSCYRGYYLNSGFCVLPNPLCQTSNSTTGWCTSCYTGYTLQGPYCVLG